VAERVKQLTEQNRHYLAHEYFNLDWHPMHFATMAQWLEPAKLQYACSANYLEHIDAINLSAEQQAFLKEIPDPMFRETTRDFMVNQQFRKDYWVKGARKLNALEQAELLRSQKLILTSHRADVSLKVTGALGEAEMTATIYNPILDLLADYKPKTLGQIEQAVKAQGITLAQIIQSDMVLTGAGHLAAVQEDNVITKTKKQTDKLNAYLCQKARGSNDINYLASPVTGGGFTVNRFQQLFLSSISQGKKQPADWAQSVWQTIAAQGQKLVKEGKTLDSAEENLAELTTQAQTFAEKQLPILRALQVV
jgi:hypothetical protein